MRTHVSCVSANSTTAATHITSVIIILTSRVNQSQAFRFGKFRTFQDGRRKEFQT